MADNPGTGLRQAAVRLILEAAGTTERDILPVSQASVRDDLGTGTPSDGISARNAYRFLERRTNDPREYGMDRKGLSRSSNAGPNEPRAPREDPAQPMETA